MDHEFLRFDKLLRLPGRDGFASIDLNSREGDEDDGLEIIFVKDGDVFNFYSTPFTYSSDELRVYAAVFRSIAQHIELFAEYAEKTRKYWEEETAKKKSEVNK